MKGNWLVLSVAKRKSVPAKAQKLKGIEQQDFVFCSFPPLRLCGNLFPYCESSARLQIEVRICERPGR